MFFDQIEAITMKLSSYLNIKCDSCVGIRNITDDITAILMGTHIIVGTPSRIYDMINRKVLGNKNLKLSNHFY
jgi:translation initiation factor 4A